MTEKEKIENLLAVLGSTEEEIASNLLAQGCFGIRGRFHRCPVAVYLKHRGLLCCVSYSSAVPYDSPAGAADLPTAVRCFARKFDQGRYPALQLEDM